MENKTTWCYVRDLDGSLWLADAPPERIVKKGDQWRFTKDAEEEDWYEVDVKTLKPFNKHLLGGIDLKQLPLPEWSDPYPIVLTITTSLSYYTVEDQ